MRPRELCRLDDGHRVGERLAAGIRAGEEPIFPADRDRADGPLGGIVVDGDAAILEEQGEGVPPLEGVADGLGEVAFGWDARELALAPETECADLRPAAVLARLAAALRRLAGDLTLDVIEPADPLQRALGKRRGGCFPDVVEIAP